MSCRAAGSRGDGHPDRDAREVSEEEGRGGGGEEEEEEEKEEAI